MRTLRTEITNFVYPKRKEQDIENLRKTIEQSLKILNEHPNIYNLSELPPDLPFFEFLKINKEEAQQACIKSHQLLLNHWLLNVDKLHCRYDNILLHINWNLKNRAKTSEDMHFGSNYWTIYWSGRQSISEDPWNQTGVMIMTSILFFLLGLWGIGVVGFWIFNNILLVLSATLALMALVHFLLIPACDTLIEKLSSQGWEATRRYNVIIDRINYSIEMQKKINEINHDSVKEAFEQYVKLAEKCPSLKIISNLKSLFHYSQVFKDHFGLFYILEVLQDKSYQSEDAELNEALMKLAFELFKHRYQKEGNKIDIIEELVNGPLSLKDKIDYLLRYHAIEKSYGLSSYFLPSKSTRLKTLLEEITSKEPIIELTPLKNQL